MFKSRGKYDSSLVHVVKVQYNQLLTKYVHNCHISCTCIHTGIHMYTCVCMYMCVFYRTDYKSKRKVWFFSPNNCWFSYIFFFLMKESIAQSMTWTKDLQYYEYNFRNILSSWEFTVYPCMFSFILVAYIPSPLILISHQIKDLPLLFCESLIKKKPCEFKAGIH